MFHNDASKDAGNGLVDCAIDPQGYGYVSGHREVGDFASYGGGGGGGGGGGDQQHGGKGGKHKKKGGQRQQQQDSGWALDEENFYDDGYATPRKVYPQKDPSLVKIGDQWCAKSDVSESAGIKYCTRPMNTDELGTPGVGVSGMPRPHPLPTTEKKSPTKIPSKDVWLSPQSPHLTNPEKHHEAITIHPEMLPKAVKEGKQPLKLPPSKEMRLSNV